MSAPPLILVNLLPPCLRYRVQFRKQAKSGFQRYAYGVAPDDDAAKKFSEERPILRGVWGMAKFSILPPYSIGVDGICAFATFRCR